MKPRESRFRKWASQVARQAGEEPDMAESQRLLTVAEYWVRRADLEESDGFVADDRRSGCD